MITALALLALTCFNMRAQTNSEYKFRQQMVSDGDSYGPQSTPDPVPILTMDCLAANGFGQWTYSRVANGNYQVGWYLLANGIYKPSLKRDADPAQNHPVAITPGVVTAGVLQGTAISGAPPEPKVTANLDGAVRYLWPDNSLARKSFVCQGFNSHDLDISEDYIKLHPQSPVLNQPSYSLLPTGPVGGEHNVLQGGPSADNFDICSDARYLYIAWSTNQNMSAGVSLTEIWTLVVDLSTNTPVAGWPKPVAVMGALAEGMRPTVACDPRQNRTGLASPNFDVSYVSYGTAAPQWFTWNNTLGQFQQHLVQKTFIKPTTNSPQNYGYAMHVRCLVSSVNGGPIQHHAMYAICDYHEATLIFYNEDNPAIPMGIAAYVDGDLVSPVLPIPPTGSTDIPGYRVIDKPLVAAANPYDNGDDLTQMPISWRGIDQFHCLYQTACPGFTPLHIVRGCDIGAQQNLPLGAVDDTRSVLSVDNNGTHQLLPDAITVYVAAINQMGIHVHFRTIANKHYYSRDISRAFDEDIEENTILTDDCNLANGLIHGGTAGASVLSNKTLTIITDMNYGNNPADPFSGLTTPHYQFGDIEPCVGQLHFEGPNVKLTISSAQGNYDEPATLVTGPYFYFCFDPDLRSQEVEVKGGNWYYFTLNRASGGLGTPGTAFTDGTRSGNGGGSAGAIRINSDLETYRQGVLWVEPGAEFYAGDRTALFVEDGGSIVMRYGPGTFPFGGSSNPARSGHITTKWQVRMTGGELGGGLYSEIPPGSSVTVFTMLPSSAWYSGTPRSDDPFFYAHDFVFDNDAPGLYHGGRAILDFGLVYDCAPAQTQPCDCIGNITIEGGECWETMIRCTDLWHPGDVSKSLEISGVDFNGILGRAVSLRRSGNETMDNFHYSIHDCNFRHFDGGDYLFGWQNYYEPGDQTYGIYVKNINARIGSIFSNTFTMTNSSIQRQGLYSAYPLSSDICLENSSAYIMGNTITDMGYWTGINSVATRIDGSFLTTNSLICGNYIANLVIPTTQRTNSGLYTAIAGQKTRGYVKLNTIVNNECGYLGDLNDQPQFIEDSITSCEILAIYMGNQSTAYLTGVHSSATGQDYSAKNALWASQPQPGFLAYTISLDHTSNLELGNNLNPGWWTRYSQNNIRGATNMAILDGEVNSNIDLGNIDNNYWGQGIDPRNGCGWSSTSHQATCGAHGNWGGSNNDARNISYEIALAPASESHLASTFTCSDSNSTGGGGSLSFGGTGKQGKRALQADSAKDCQVLYSWGFEFQQDGRDQDAYDTLKKYVQTCPWHRYAPNAFGLMQGPIGHLANKNLSLWGQHREWLESVLYLNTENPQYFCQCVEAISGAMAYESDTTRILRLQATNRSLAILKWLIDNTGCDTAMNRKDYDQSRASQIDSWKFDTTNALDTTLPSMKELGLDTLLAKHAFYEHQNHGGVQSSEISILASASTSPNPTTNGTVLTFDMSQAAYVKVEVYDLLGNAVRAGGFEQYLGAGNHSVPIDLTTLASGTYYARIVTAYGETRTVRIVRE